MVSTAQHVCPATHMRGTKSDCCSAPPPREAGQPDLCNEQLTHTYPYLLMCSSICSLNIKIKLVSCEFMLEIGTQLGIMMMIAVSSLNIYIKLRDKKDVKKKEHQQFHLPPFREHLLPRSPLTEVTEHPLDTTPVTPSPGTARQDHILDPARCCLTSCGAGNPLKKKGTSACQAPTVTPIAFCRICLRRTLFCSFSVSLFPSLQISLYTLVILFFFLETIAVELDPSNRKTGGIHQAFERETINDQRERAERFSK